MNNLKKCNLIWVKKHTTFLSICIFYLVLFLPFIGNVMLFDWDEINFAEAAREMLVTNDWLNVKIDYLPFWEKPPLFIWLQALSMKVFGISSFAARLPNVLVGLATISILYFSLIRKFGKPTAVFSILFYLGSITPHFYFKTGIIDPLYNLLIFISIIYLIKCVDNGKSHSFFYAGLFLGLAVLTKGPAALLIVGITGLTYQLIYGDHFYNFKSLLVLLLGILLFPCLYFGLQVAQNGWWFLNEFIIYQIELFSSPVASHGQPFYYHFIVLLLGCFPVFIFAISSMLRKNTLYGSITYYRWMQILFWVVLIVFSLVTTKIVHYSSLCYLPLCVVGGVWLSNFKILEKNQKFSLIFVGIIWSILLGFLGYLGVDKSKIICTVTPYIKDNFVLQQLHTDVHWSIFPLFLGIALLVLILRTCMRPSKLNITSFLVSNTLLITFIAVSVVPSVEQAIQGHWKKQLATYQNKTMKHFTVGFKSYAHLFYTQQRPMPQVEAIRDSILQKRSLQATIYTLNQEEIKQLDNEVRDYIVHKTDMPVSVSAKVFDFKKMNKNYPELTMVFEGNGYGIWERTTILDK